MLLKIFKSHHPFIIFFIPLFAFSIWFITFFNPHSHDYYIPDTNMFLYSWFTGLYNNNFFISSILSLVLIIIQTFLIIRINFKYIFIRTRTYLPAFIYILIIGSYIPFHNLHPVIIGNLFLILSINKFFINKKEKNLISNYFEVGLLLSIGSLFYFNLIYCIVLIWISLLILRTFYWREWFISLIGLSFGYLILFIISFFNNSLDYTIDIIFNNFKSFYLYPEISIFQLIFYSFLGFLIFISVINLFFTINMKKIQTRKYFGFFIWAIIISVLFFVLIPSMSMDVLIIIAIPATYVLSDYYVNTKSKWWKESTFGILLALLILQIIL
ncbi:MAG: hypothetical protein KAT68_00345 [Bacteroidales bacterium]|nr:hypothetical protein [Bacteroidales bacterium]